MADDVLLAFAFEYPVRLSALTLFDAMCGMVWGFRSDCILREYTVGRPVFLFFDIYLPVVRLPSTFLFFQDAGFDLLKRGAGDWGFRRVRFDGALRYRPGIQVFQPPPVGKSQTLVTYCVIYKISRFSLDLPAMNNAAEICHVPQHEVNTRIDKYVLHSSHRFATRLG